MEKKMTFNYFYGRDSQLAAAILRDVPEARLRELEKPVVTIAL